MTKKQKVILTSLIVGSMTVTVSCTKQELLPKNDNPTTKSTNINNESTTPTGSSSKLSYCW
jgi:hypothetical protein